MATYEKIDPEFKTRWLSALRSGRYVQTESVLRRKDHASGRYEYCCLGVGCNLLDSRKWKVDEAEGGFAWGKIGSTETKGLPFVNAKAASTLSEMNDGCGVYSPTGFDGIADWIEANL